MWKDIAILAIKKTRVKGARKLQVVGTGALYGEQQFCFDKGYKEGVAAARKAFLKAIEQEMK